MLEHASVEVAAHLVAVHLVEEHLEEEPPEGEAEVCPPLLPIPQAMAGV